MDRHAPVKRRVKRREMNDCRWLSSEARAAKQLRRHLERRYRRTGKKSDKEAYDQWCIAKNRGGYTLYKRGDQRAGERRNPPPLPPSGVRAESRSKTGFGTFCV